MDAVDAAEGIAVLAHPSEYHSMDLLRELCRNYCRTAVLKLSSAQHGGDEVEMLRLAEKYDFAVTGGTDYHGFYTTKKTWSARSRWLNPNLINYFLNEKSKCKMLRISH